MNQAQKIRITLKASDYNLLDRSSERIVNAVKLTGVHIVGPVPLPTKKEKFTVMKSPHGDKKANEKFQLTTYKCLIDLHIPTMEKSHSVLDSLMKVELQAGVDVNIRG